MKYVQNIWQRLSAIAIWTEKTGPDNRFVYRTSFFTFIQKSRFSVFPFLIRQTIFELKGIGNTRKMEITEIQRYKIALERLKQLSDASGIHHWISAAIHFKRYKSYSDNWTKSKRKCKVFTFNGFRSWSCTAFFQSFCEISSAMYKTLIDKGFHRICYRTLDYFHKDNVFLVNLWLLLK